MSNKMQRALGEIIYVYGHKTFYNYVTLKADTDLESLVAKTIEFNDKFDTWCESSESGSPTLNWGEGWNDDTDFILIERAKSEPPLDRCMCSHCGWDGLPSECDKEIEQESWEMPEYIVYLCPECDAEEGVEFYPSDAWLERNGYE